jgi:hypothetical protein
MVEWCDTPETERREQQGIQSTPKHWKRPLYSTSQANTHTPTALYETFAPAEARRITRKLELHYTPKHGSWLNMAECEFEPGRIPGQDLGACLRREVA